jgi:hypothetical protein
MEVRMRTAISGSATTQERLSWPWNKIPGDLKKEK